MWYSDQNVLDKITVNFIYNMSLTFPHCDISPNLVYFVFDTYFRMLSNLDSKYKKFIKKPCAF